MRRIAADGWSGSSDPSGTVLNDASLPADPPRTSAQVPPVDLGFRSDGLQGGQEPFDPRTRVPVRTYGSAALNPRDAGTAPATRPIPRLTAVTDPGTAPTGEQEADVRDLEGADEREQAEARLRLRRGRMITAVVVGALVLVVGVVALLGGFQRRTDLLTPVAVGSVITTGPYEVTLASATVQHRTSTDEWVVVASGTALTTGTTSIAPSTGDSGFMFARGAAGGDVKGAGSVTLGQTEGVGGQDSLTPGLPPVPWAVTFRFSTAPGDALKVAVFDQAYTTPYLFSDELSWRSTNKASTFTLPLEQLADTDY